MQKISKHFANIKIILSANSSPTGLFILFMLAMMNVGIANASSAKNAPTTVTKIAPNANAELVKFHERFQPAQLVKMGDRVHMSFGHDYANFTFIEGDDGVIMVDTGFQINRAKHALEDFRKLSNKPIKAIVYTHVHADHRGGSPVFAKEAQGDLPVYAPAGWQERHEYDISPIRPLVVRRALSQFGMMLPVGEQGTVGAGIGPVTRLDGGAKFVLPTVTVTDRTEVTISGVRMVFIPTPGDIESNMMVWLPDDKVLITGDLLGGTLPYIATARFERDREAQKFVAGLDKVSQYPAQYIAPGHGRPLMGKKDVQDVVQVNRDVSQFLADQVTRYVVKGYTPDQIVDTLKLPPHLASHPDLQPHYHKLGWLIRGMYLKRAGWVHNTLSLIRHTNSEEAKRLVELLGGIDQVAQHALKAQNNADYPWAAQLAQYALEIDPDHSLARDVKMEAFQGIANSTRSANERNFLLTSIKDMKKEIPWQRVFVGTGLNSQANLPSAKMLEMMRFRFKAENALEAQMTLGVSIEGETDNYALQVRRGILIVHKESSQKLDGKVVLHKKILLKLSVGALTWSKALAMGAIKIEYGNETVKQFVQLIE
jgi:alkyl sulfatase BDS1-like metallo-beta-lactamase superfamily hydrolase